MGNNIEIKMFKNLPPNLRNDIIDLKGNKVDIDFIDPFSLICVEVSGNPGEVLSKSLISQEETTFDFFAKKAKDLNFEIPKFVEKLSKGGTPK